MNIPGPHKIRNDVGRALYQWLCREILDTRPLVIKPAPLTFCSMVSHRDILMYLVAIKSVYPKIGEGTVCIINDGSLQPKDIERLNYHLGSPMFVDIAAIDTGGCPRGALWERLLYILGSTEHNYVIQVDSDIVARGPIDEVVQCYRDNHSFTLGSGAGQHFTNLAEAATYAKAADDGHIQVIAERNFDRLNEIRGKRYVRGCAGFAGFARGTSLRRLAEDFSATMSKLIGPRWSDWGSEQVTSNYVVANSGDAVVLPWPKYANLDPNIRFKESSLLHFLGSRRFYKLRYITESRQVIKKLKQSDRQRLQ